MRSKVLIVSNILATILAVIITCVTVNLIDSFASLEAYGEIYSVSISRADFVSAYILTAPYLLIVQSAIFIVAVLFGWISWLAKKSGLAKFAAFLYILGGICYIQFTFFSIPVIILGFIGGSKQKSLNKSKAVVNTAPVEIPTAEEPAEEKAE